MRKVGALLLVAVVVAFTILFAALLGSDEEAGEPFPSDDTTRVSTIDPVRRSRELAPTRPMETESKTGRIEIRFVAAGDRVPRRPIEVELLGVGKRTASDTRGEVRWDLPPGAYRWFKRSGPAVDLTPAPENHDGEAGVRGKARTWRIDGNRPAVETSGPIPLTGGETVRLTVRVHDGIRLLGKIPTERDECRIEAYALRTRRHPVDAAADIHERISRARTHRTDDGGGFLFEDLAPGEHIVTAWWRSTSTHTFAHAEVLLEDDRDHDLGELQVLDTSASLRITAQGFDPSGVRPSLSLLRKDVAGPVFTFLGSFETQSTFLGLDPGLWSVGPLGAAPFPQRLRVLAPDLTDLPVPGRDTVVLEYRLAPLRGTASLTFVLPDRRGYSIDYQVERKGGGALGFTAHGTNEIVATEPLDPGRYVVRATARADGETGPTHFGSSEIRIVSGETATARIALDPGILLRGVATTPNGPPYNGPVVLSLLNENPEASYALVDAVEGAFSFFAPKGATVGCMNGSGQVVAAPGAVLTAVVDAFERRR